MAGEVGEPTGRGFGNAFLEAIYYRRPILVNRYPGYIVDIESKGFDVITIDGFLTDSALAKVREVLTDADRRKAMVEHNLQVARKFLSDPPKRAGQPDLKLLRNIPAAEPHRPPVPVGVNAFTESGCSRSDQTRCSSQKAAHEAPGCTPACLSGRKKPVSKGKQPFGIELRIGVWSEMILSDAPAHFVSQLLHASVGSIRDERIRRNVLVEPHLETPKIDLPRFAVLQDFKRLGAEGIAEEKVGRIPCPVQASPFARNTVFLLVIVAFDPAGAETEDADVPGAISVKHGRFASGDERWIPVTPDPTIRVIDLFSILAS